MIDIAIIENNIVQNVAVFEDMETAKEQYPHAVLIDTAVIHCGIGWTYDPETGVLASPEPARAPTQSTAELEARLAEMEALVKKLLGGS